MIHPKARKTASGAVGMLRNARIVDGWDDAVANCSLVVGATSRTGTSLTEKTFTCTTRKECDRISNKRPPKNGPECVDNERPVYSPRECARLILGDEPYRNDHVAVVFGPEHGGLSDDCLRRCDAYLTIPTDPTFPSLNLAMAVQIWAYEVRMACMDKGIGDIDNNEIPEPPNAPHRIVEETSFTRRAANTWSIKYRAEST